MKTAVTAMLGLVLSFGLVAVGFTEEKKDKEKVVTLKGTICCSKCELGETAKCGNAIKVKEKDKDVIYYFKDNGKEEKYHGKICQAPAEGTVKGVVSEKDGKKYITPAKDGVKYD